MAESEMTALMNPGIQLFFFFLFNSRTKCQSNKLKHQDLYIYEDPRMSERLILNCWMQSHQCHLRDQDTRIKYDTEQIDLYPVLFLNMSHQLFTFLPLKGTSFMTSRILWCEHFAKLGYPMEAEA